MPAGQAHRKEAPLRDQARAPRKYELMTILHPEIAEESLPGELERISGFITAAGGELIETLQDSPCAGENGLHQYFRMQSWALSGTGPLQALFYLSLAGFCSSLA